MVLSVQVFDKFILIFYDYKLCLFSIETATYINLYMYGSGDKQISSQMWLIKEENFNAYMTVSSDGHCITLTQTLSLTSPSMSSFVYPSCPKWRNHRLKRVNNVDE